MVVNLFKENRLLSKKPPSHEELLLMVDLESWSNFKEAGRPLRTAGLDLGVSCFKVPTFLGLVSRNTEIHWGVP